LIEEKELYNLRESLLPPAEMLGVNGEHMQKPEVTLEEALGTAEHVMVARLGQCWPPEFAIVVMTGEQSDGPLTFGGFASRTAAWDAVEAVSSQKRPLPKPDQDFIDNTRWAWDVDCGAENGTRSTA
jgi:hypothetical protein